MTIDKKLKFLQPFLDEVQDIIPLKRLRRIYAYSVPLHKNEQVYGRCGIVNGKFNISLLTTLNDYPKKRQRSIFLETILVTLAHELSHMKYGEHDHRSFGLQSIIQLHFSNVLKKLNIKDTYVRIDKLTL